MKNNINFISKPKMTLLLGLVVISLGGVYVMANSILGTKHQFASTTDVLGTSTNNYYDVKVVSKQLTPTKDMGGVSITRVGLQIGVTNKTANTLQIAPGLQMFLASNTGKVYPITARYVSPGVVIGGPLAGNSYTQMNIDFDLPASEQPESLTFQEDLSKPIVTIKL
jgi:hypothetical protein